MSALLHILRSKLRMFLAMPSSPDTGTVVRSAGSFVVFGSFAVGAFFFSNFITAYLLETVGIGLFLFHRFIGMLLFVFFVTVNLGNMVVAFTTLYRSPEVSFLLTAPVSYLNIFIIKFLDNFFYSSGTLFMVGLSVLLGYGVYFGYPWHFYLLMMFGVMVPFMFLAACIAVIVLLFLMTLAPRVNFRVLVGGIVLFYIGQIYLYFTVTSPVRLVQEVMKFYPYVNLYFGSLDPVIAKFLPNYWVSEILYFYVNDNFEAVGGYVALMLLTTAGLFVLLLAAANGLYYRTWLASLSLKRLTVKRFEAKDMVFAFGRRSWFAPVTEVLLKKEFWQFVREPAQWIHFVVMMGLLTVFLSSVSTLSIRLESPELKAVVYLVVFIFNIFLINAVALRFGFPVMSLEGKAYWSVRSAPVRLSSVYRTKFLVTAAFLVLLSVAVAFLSNIPYLFVRSVTDLATGRMETVTPHDDVRALAWMTIALTPVVTFALVSLNVALGAVYADFAEKNPVRIASSQGATMTFLLSIVYIVLLLALYYYPTLMVFNAELKQVPADWRVIRFAAASIAVPSLLLAAGVHIAGLRSLRRDLA
ncbi:MAG: hypothetical protein F9K22_03115 [Bacteroidetes bacterium]|nr:MAG: hypothetical protein F9K22_03115 [Bacteroidota bacterium]